MDTHRKITENSTSRNIKQETSEKGRISRSPLLQNAAGIALLVVTRLEARQLKHRCSFPPPPPTKTFPRPRHISPIQRNSQAYIPPPYSRIHFLPRRQETTLPSPKQRTVLRRRTALRTTTTHWAGELQTSINLTLNFVHDKPRNVKISTPRARAMHIVGF